MCGICGVVRSESNRTVHDRLIESLCDTIVNRGPDERGVFACRQVGLGSQRLSIIDLEGGSQPIFNEDRTLAVVLNGEIYNYHELTRLLIERGHRFYTRSDTETIVHAYEEFKDDFPSHLNGMFAFALWDEKERRLILARDRTGIKPLYYAFFDQSLIFGSELKVLLAYPNMPRNLDLSALNEYMSFEYVPTPKTIFQGIFKLPPGSTLIFEKGKIRIQPYWDVNLAASEQVRRKRPEEYVSELTEVLRESIRKEMVSDVPIGVLLSGGLDSSAVAAFMAECAPNRLESFSIIFDDPSFDESQYASEVARFVGAKPHEMKLTPQMMLELAPRIVEFLDEPLGDSSIIPTYLLCQFTRSHVKVALGGDGGDELFGGYSTLQAHRLFQYYERLAPSFLRSQILPKLVKALPVSFDNISFDFKLRRFIAGHGKPPIVRHHQWLGSFTPEQKQRLFASDILTSLTETNQTYSVALEHLKNASNVKELINQILYCDMKLYLEGDILPKVDRSSMACSLEVRAPLLNHTLVEYVTALPYDLKLNGMTTKYILRKLLKGRLPERILQRGKKGFNIPVAKWLAKELKPLALDMLSPAKLKSQGIFNPTYVQRLLDEHLAKRFDHRKLLWTLLIFQMWYDRWAK
jgi:asparagine synthase (glutamine-hydrolysing)